MGSFGAVGNPGAPAAGGAAAALGACGAPGGVARFLGVTGGRGMTGARAPSGNPPGKGWRGPERSGACAAPLPAAWLEAGTEGGPEAGPERTCPGMCWPAGVESNWPGLGDIGNSYDYHDAGTDGAAL